MQNQRGTRRLIAFALAVFLVFPLVHIDSILYLCGMSGELVERCCCAPDVKSSEFDQIGRDSCAKPVHIDATSQTRNVERNQFRNMVEPVGSFQITQAPIDKDICPPKALVIDAALHPPDVIYSLNCVWLI